MVLRLRSCVKIRYEFAFQLGDHVFELQLAPLEALNAQPVVVIAVNEMLDDDIQVAMLYAQFIQPYLYFSLIQKLKVASVISEFVA